jgi:hypothetical protein
MSDQHKPLSTSKKSKPVDTHVPLKTAGKPVLISGEGMKVVPMESGTQTVPTLIYRNGENDPPETGARVSFVHENGFTYTGDVDEVTTIDGEVLLTFVGQLTYAK